VLCRPASTPLAEFLPPDVAGVSMPVPWAATLDLVLRLQPDVERVAFIGGVGDSDRRLVADARPALSANRDRVTLTDLTGLPMPQLLEAVRSLSAGTVILFGGFLRDGAGRTFTTPEAVQLVAAASAVPIYGAADTLIGHGVVGGAVMRFDDLGARVAELGLRVLGGERPGAELVTADAGVPMFDARQLRRRGIDERRLPAGSVVQFRSPSAWELYRWPIIGAAALIALQVALIAGLLVERGRRRHAQRGLDEQLRFERLLAEVAARLAAIAPGEVDRVIESALGRIAKTLGIDRASLARLADGGEHLALTHWATQGGTGPVPSVVAAGQFPWTTRRLREGHTVRLSGLDDLPPDAIEDRESFRVSGTRSIVIVPLRVGGEVVGGLGFTSHRGERRWPEDLVQRLQLLGEILATALARQQAERALRESEEHLVLMMETAPCMIWMAGSDGRCTYFNGQWLTFTGRKLDDELGDGWADGIHPDDATRCVDEYRRAFAARTPFTLQYRLRHASGEYRWVLDFGAPRHGPAGAFAGYMGSCIDVTDVQAAQQVLLEHAALRSAAFSSLYGQLAAVDRDGMVLTVNEAWTQTAPTGGLRPPVGVNYLAACRDAAAAGHPHAASVAEAIESVLEGRAPAALEYPVATPAGERWFEMLVEPFRRPEGGAVVAHVDITRRRRAEDEVRHRRDELAHVLRTTTMGELAGSLAHEINQPLAAILTNAQAARRVVEADGHDPEDLREVLGDIADDAKRAAEIIGRLRALFRREEARLEEVDLNAITRGTATLLRHDFQRKGIAVTFDFAQGLPPVAADPVQLQQVILNLFLNAVDAVVAAGGTRREITALTASRDGSVELAVSDTGAGVPEADLERIFSPFVTTKSGGLGMGLAISRSIVMAHGGRLSATRQPGGGLVVSLSLPAPSHPGGAASA
jgi:PAS domain S-box-containing protein